MTPPTSVDPARSPICYPGQLEGVVEPLAFGAVILRGRLLAQGLEDRADGRRALGDEVAADHCGAAGGGADLDGAVLEGVVRVAGAG